MALGEVANFGAYAFVPAILVTPLGAISVVVAAVLSSIFLKEYLDFSGKIGCLQCVLGAVIIVLNAPPHNSTTTVTDFFSYVITPVFLVYTCMMFGAVFYLIRYMAPKYGNKHPVVYISICSLIGAYLVLSAQGFGAAVVHTFNNYGNAAENQFLLWPIYPLLAFVLFTITLQINYLNKALNLFSTAIVTPVYYVFFTGATIISSAVLFRGFQDVQIIAGVSMMIGFLIIVGGVALLFQYSIKVLKEKNPSFLSLPQSTQVLSGEDLQTKSVHREEEGPIKSSRGEDVAIEMTTQNFLNSSLKAKLSPTPSVDFSSMHKTRDTLGKIVRSMSDVQRRITTTGDTGVFFDKAELGAVVSRDGSVVDSNEFLIASK